MKREILFRGKRVDNGEWVYGKGLQQCKDELGNEIVAIFEDIVKSEKYIKKEGRYTLYYVPVKAETLGQYTGLKDKNGKKIFEGDVVIIGEKLKAKVIYYDGAFRMQSEFSPTPIDTTDMGYMMREFSVRVIGNIHDNPELIKKSV
nr:MAG TPA: YopX protein [Caudoviricetes sp.]